MEIEYLLELTEAIVTKELPDELVALDAIKERALADSQWMDSWASNKENFAPAMIGSGVGSETTILAPWILLIVKETIQLFREVALEILKLRMSHESKGFPLGRSEVPETKLIELRDEIRAVLEARGFKSPDNEEVIALVIDSMLFDPRVAPILMKSIESGD